MYTLISLLTLCIITPGQPMSYPVFGTKRYHRAAGNGIIPPLATAGFVSNPPVQYYNSPPQYYDDPSAYLPHGYSTDSGYYYYPRHEYHSYGLPTFRGEYKPTRYYYAPGPSYSYYDDHEISTNPLDDLHEEMLQEDERARQRELIPTQRENWIENTEQQQKQQQQQQDALTNNFLKNLIAYNREINAQQEEQEELLEKHPEIQPNEFYQHDEPNEYEDYSETTDYEYEPQQESIYDLKKYENLNSPTHRGDDLRGKPSVPERYYENLDEDERQLKSLAHHANNNHHVSDNRNNNNNNNNNQIYHPDNAYQQDIYPNPKHSLSSSFVQYDNDPEYDDDSWINWDRKRNFPSMSATKKDESIKAFSNRKPSAIIQNMEKLKSSTKKPILKEKPTEKESAATQSLSATSTTPMFTTLQPKFNAKVSGQKEVVLPRPASPTQHLFAATPDLDLIHNKAPSDEEEEEEEEESRKRAANKHNPNVYETIKQLLAMEQKLQMNTPTESKLKKRFVSNEESLVQELDNLKRTSF